MSKVLDVEVTANNDGTFQARIAGYRAQGCTIETAVANVAGVAARELCGEWRAYRGEGRRIYAAAVATVCADAVTGPSMAANETRTGEAA